MRTYWKLRPLGWMLGIFLVALVLRASLISVAQWSLVPIDYTQALTRSPEVITIIIVPMLLLAAFALLMSHLFHVRKQVWYEGYLLKMWREREALVKKGVPEESDWAFSNLAKDPDPLVIPPRRYVSVVWRSIAALMLVIMLVLLVLALANHPAFEPLELVLLLLGCASMGLAEELLFRGVLLSLSRKIRCSEVTSAILITVLYVLWYLGNVGLTGSVSDIILDSGRAFLTGISFYAMRRTFGRLSVSIAAHSVWIFILVIL